MCAIANYCSRDEDTRLLPPSRTREGRSETPGDSTAVLVQSWMKNNNWRERLVFCLKAGTRQDWCP